MEGTSRWIMPNLLIGSTKQRICVQCCSLKGRVRKDSLIDLMKHELKGDLLYMSLKFQNDFGTQ